MQWQTDSVIIFIKLNRAVKGGHSYFKHVTICQIPSLFVIFRAWCYMFSHHIDLLIYKLQTHSFLLHHINSHLPIISHLPTLMTRNYPIYATIPWINDDSRALLWSFFSITLIFQFIKTLNVWSALLSHCEWFLT